MKMKSLALQNVRAEPRTRGAGLCPLGQRLHCHGHALEQQRRQASRARPPDATGPPPACSWGRRARQRLVRKFYGKL